MWKQAKRNGVNTWLALGDLKIDGKGGKKNNTHTHKHKSTAVTLFQVNWCKVTMVSFTSDSRSTQMEKGQMIAAKTRKPVKSECDDT